jgi:hypothetical protein
MHDMHEIDCVRNQRFRLNVVMIRMGSPWVESKSLCGMQHHPTSEHLQRSGSCPIVVRVEGCNRFINVANDCEFSEYEPPL